MAECGGEAHAVNNFDRVKLVADAGNSATLRLRRIMNSSGGGRIQALQAHRFALLQDVSDGRKAARGRIADRGARQIGSVGRARRYIAGRIQFDVGLHIVQDIGVGRPFAILQRPGLNRAVDLAQVVDAGLLL